MSDDLSIAAARMRSSTPARIGLGRAGAAMTTSDVLAFEAALANAREAVFSSIDHGSLASDLAPFGYVAVRSQATDRPTYLRRPDLGRRLALADRALLNHGTSDLALIIADDLSATAVHREAPATVRAIMARTGGLKVATLVVAEQARVAIADEIGQIMGARVSAILIGERPGLSSPHSLGIYITANPRIGRTDAERNCISNIHAFGLSPAAAADKLMWLYREIRRLGFSGVDLKERETAGLSTMPGLGNGDA